MFFKFSKKPSMSVIFVFVFVTLLTRVNSEIGGRDSLLESTENIKGHFVGILEAAVNKTSSVSDFVISLFPEIDEVDLQDEDLDPIKIDLKELFVNAQELGSLLDKNEDGQITMDEVTPLDADRQAKVDAILKEIVEIHRNIDVKFEEQDSEYFDEDILVAEDEDLIDLDDDPIDFHDEL